MINLDRGACRTVDPAVMNPDPGDAVAEGTAKQLCGRCEVRLECLAVALRSGALSGVWGGLTEAERGRYRRQRSLPLSRR